MRHWRKITLTITHTCESHTAGVAEMTQLVLQPAKICDTGENITLTITHTCESHTAGVAEMTQLVLLPVQICDTGEK